MKAIVINKDKGILLPQKRVRVSDGKVYVEDDRWITINADKEEGRKGQHVLIKENGTIVYGLGGKFKNLSELGGKKKKGVLFSEDDAKKIIDSEADKEKVSPARYRNCPYMQYQGLIRSVQYNPVQYHTKQPSMEEIIDNLSGGDKTKGSCVSLAIAYTAQRGGLDVLDFRGGGSQTFFSQSMGLHATLKDGLAHEGRDSRKGAIEVLENLKNYPPDKEFLLRSGNHMAVVRRNKDGVIQYLEMQSSWRKNEWYDMGETESKNGRKNIETTLRNRFKTKTDRSSDAYYYTTDLYDCDKLRQSQTFKVALGFINTDKDKQQKGKGGGEK